MLDPQRVQEMFWLFSKVLPIGDSDKSKASQLFGVEFTKLIPDLALTLGSQCSKNLDDFEGYCDFILEAVAYMKNETNEQPRIDMDNEKLKEHMRASLTEFRLNAKSTKF